MKKVLIIIVSLLALVLLTSCEKEPQVELTGEVTFYMTDSSAWMWNLYVDGVNMGPVKRAVQMPVCGDPDFLNVTLPVGIHKYQLKGDFETGVLRDFEVGAGCQQVRCAL